ncbi:MAG: hypothetical protein CML59_00580 [Rhodobacteraceae bacterium]|nr:hypothetical protein [Paracoccaceae bacterium]
MKIRVWNRGLVLNFSKRSVIYQKRGAKKVFGGYIYLELSKKILFHQIWFPDCVFSKDISVKGIER